MNSIKYCPIHGMTEFKDGHCVKCVVKAQIQADEDRKIFNIMYDIEPKKIVTK